MRVRHYAMLLRMLRERMSDVRRAMERLPERMLMPNILPSSVPRHVACFMPRRFSLICCRHAGLNISLFFAFILSLPRLFLSRYAMSAAATPILSLPVLMLMFAAVDFAAARFRRLILPRPRCCFHDTPPPPFLRRRC